MNVQLEFGREVSICAVKIYEVFNSGGVKKISALYYGNWVPLWQTEQIQCLKEARIFSPQLSVQYYKERQSKNKASLVISNWKIEIQYV